MEDTEFFGRKLNKLVRSAKYKQSKKLKLRRKLARKVKALKQRNWS